MKSILIASLLMFTSAGLFAGEDIGVEKSVFEAEKAWIDAGAKFDIDAFDKLMRDDFIGVKVDGTTLGRRDFLGEVDRATPAQKEARAKVTMTLSAVRMRLYGTVAVVVGSSTLPGPKPVNLRFTHIWVKTDDKWLMSTSQETPMIESKPTTRAKPVHITKPAKAS